MDSAPIIALTMGDPAGIGPEVIVKAFQDDTLHLQSRTVVIGDARLLQATAKKYAPEILVHAIARPDQGWYQTCTIDVIDLNNVPENISVGKPSSQAGQASYEAIKTAVDLALNDEVSAITTAPINKKSLHLAGYPFPGHTELLAHLTNSKQAALMMAGNSLRVVLVTTHVPLEQVKPLITQERVLNTIYLTHEWLIQHVTDVPSIAVTGLNPHCGDGGIFGQEESDHILQLICQLLVLNLRDEDLICRLAGDRFVVLLHNTSEHEAQQMSMDLQNAVASFAYRTRQHHQRVYLSATVVTTMARTDDSDSLIKRLNLEISKTRQQPSNAL